MRVFAKKAFEFTRPVSGEKASVSPLVFTDVPDWVTKDTLFAWAKADGDIEVIQSTAKAKEVEKKVSGKEDGKDKPPADPTDPTKLLGGPPQE